MLKYIIFLILIALFTGCALVNTPLPEPDSRGAKTYKDICTRCHALAHPRRNTYAQWQHLVAIMEKRMEERQIPPMRISEKELILEYLRANSR